MTWTWPECGHLRELNYARDVLSASTRFGAGAGVGILPATGYETHMAELCREGVGSLHGYKPKDLLHDAGARGSMAQTSR